ncbi:MAG: ArsR/SmtB family transcription factor [Actinomycetota bacterium]
MAIPVTLANEELPVACCTPLTARMLSDDQANATAALFKALADPNRVRIVNLLSTAADPVCVCDITAHLGLSQSTVSFHLKKLVSSGLLEREQRGTWGFYSIEPKALTTLTDVVRPKGTSR